LKVQLQDWKKTETGPNLNRSRLEILRTDQDCMQPQSSLQSITISKYSRLIKAGLNQSQPIFTTLKAGYSKVRYLHNISTSKVMEVLDELIMWPWKIPDNRSMMTNIVDHNL